MTIAALSICCLALAGSTDVQRQGPAPVPAGGFTADGPITVVELASDFSWGYKCGVKQPVGASMDGLSIHQITDSNHPPGNHGNPDYIFWVDESAGTSGIAERPTGYDDFQQNTGGMATFDPAGTIWFTHGGHAPDSPLGLYSSVAPLDPGLFTTDIAVLDDNSGSTTSCVTVNGSKLLLIWRHGHSTGIQTTVRMRRYDVGADFSDPPELEIDLGQGMAHEIGNLGIEQLWTRFDPRFGYHFVTWQNYLTGGPLPLFGANPFLYTDDDGATWRRADGTALALPVTYGDTGEVLTPFDHIAASKSTGWWISDIGVSPGGVFWMTLLDLFGGPTAEFWRFTGTAWERTDMAVTGLCMPFACGATKDYLVFMYSSSDLPWVLNARISDDDGATWSDPVIVDQLDSSLRFSWVSFVQPTAGYPDNAARFFYGYARYEDGTNGLRYLNNIRWIRFDPDALRPADIDGDGVVGITDFLLLLAAWGPCSACAAPEDCPADVNGDCVVGIEDLLLLLADWG